MRWLVLIAVLVYSGHSLAMELEEAEMRQCGSEAWRMLHPENGDGFAYDTRDVINGKSVGELAVHCGKQLPPGWQRDAYIKTAKKYLAGHPEMPIIPPSSMLIGQ